MLNEAISVKNKESALRLIVSKLEKDLGQKLHKYGVLHFQNKFGLQTGIKYFIGNTVKSVRFNWLTVGSSTEITSIDIWDVGAKSDKPTIHIDTKGISLATVIPELSKAIKNPVVSKVNESISINEKKVTVDGVEYKGILPALDSLYKKNKDLTPEEAHAKMKEVLPLDNAKRLHKLWLKNGTVETIIASKKEKVAEVKLEKTTFADPEVVFEEVKTVAEMVIKKQQNSLIITGMSGVGKTQLIDKIIKDQGIKKNKDYIEFTGSAEDLYVELYNNKTKLFLFKEGDSILKDKDSAAILKSIIPNNVKVREVSSSKNTFDVKKMSQKEIAEVISKEDKYPSSFEFTGQVILLSNTPKSKIESSSIANSIVIDIQLTQKDLFNRMRSVIDDIAVEDKKEDKEMIIDFLETEYKHPQSEPITIKTFLSALSCYKSGSPIWKNLVAYAT